METFHYKLFFRKHELKLRLTMFRNLSIMLSIPWGWKMLVDQKIRCRPWLLSTNLKFSSLFCFICTIHMNNQVLKFQVHSWTILRIIQAALIENTNTKMTSIKKESELLPSNQKIWNSQYKIETNEIHTSLLFSTPQKLNFFHGSLSRLFFLFIRKRVRKIIAGLVLQVFNGIRKEFDVETAFVQRKLGLERKLP